MNKFISVPINWDVWFKEELTARQNYISWGTSINNLWFDVNVHRPYHVSSNLYGLPGIDIVKVNVLHNFWTAFIKFYKTLTPPTCDN